MGHIVRHADGLITLFKMKPFRKLILSILLGMSGFWLSLYSIQFAAPPDPITLTWSYCLPLLAGMAYGPAYGLIAGVLGLGAFYPFLIYPNDGWANLVSSVAMALWFACYGYFAGARQKKAAFWNHPFFVHVPFAVFYFLFMRLLFPIAFSLNPPFWNPASATTAAIPQLVETIAQNLIMMYVVVVLDTCILKVDFIRRLLGLETARESRNNGRIVLTAVLGAFFLWFVFLVFNHVFVENDFLQKAVRIAEPYEIVALVVILFAGFFIGAILCQDVESRLKAEEDSGKSRENYRLIFEQAADGIFIVDAQGNFADINESGCKLMGYSRDEVLRLNLRDVVLVDGLEDALFRLDEIHAGDTLFLEQKMRHKNGSSIFVEINVRKLADGRFQGLVRDVSRHKQVEEALRANDELFTQFMRHSPIYVYIKEVSPTQSYTLHASENYQDMIGIPGSQMVGKNMYELFPAEFAAKITVDDWEVVSQGSVLHLEEELNGRSYTTIKFPIHYKEKSYLAGYTIDITGQKNFENQIKQLNAGLEQRVAERTKQLEAANKELEAFAYSVSHDLRAPLRALEGFSHILLEDYSGLLDGSGQAYLARIQEAAQRMGQLINDLLDLSRITRVDLHYQRVDLSGLVQSIACELAGGAPERRIDFEIAPRMVVEGDANLLKIALENLLNNAVKFTRQCNPAVIQIGVTEQSGEQVYYVKDNGVGFDMNYVDRLFSPFQRLHSAKEFPGSGIGLSIVQRIIARHGGRIWPESKVGSGTVFYFALKNAD